MVELLRPGVKVIERFEIAPVIEGVGVSTGAMVGVAKKGPTQSARLLTSFEDFIRIYGGFFKGNLLPFAVKSFFDNGGRRMFASRVVGSGNSASTINLGDMGDQASSGAIVSSGAAPFNMEPADTLIIDVDAGGNVTATFDAAAALIECATAETYDFSAGGSETLTVKIDGGAVQTISFPDSDFAAPAAATAEEVAQSINAQIVGAFATVTTAGTKVTITSDKRGTGSGVEVTGGSANALLSFSTAPVTGSGDVADIDAVTAAEIKTVVEADVAGLTVSGTTTITITSDTSGASSSIKVDATSTLDTVMGFDNVLHSGANSAAVNTVQVDAANPGDWGNNVSITTLKAKTTLSVNLGTGNQTSATLTSAQGFEKGDLVEVTDGTTTEFLFLTNVNLTTNVITFTEEAIGSTINSGSTVRTSTVHLDNTITTTALVNNDTQVTLTTARNARVGSIYIIGGITEKVTVIVTQVSGNTIFFDAVTLSGTILVGSRIASQEFTLVVLDGGVIVERLENLTMEETDETNFIEVKVAGRGNLSDFIILTDLDSTTTDRVRQIPRAIEDTFLLGGNDGSAPTDSEFIGAQTPGSKTGIFLFDPIDEVNIVSTPGVTTQVVQENGVTYCENRDDCMYVMETPLSVDTPEEARDYRLFTLNIDSSFTALYWPWLTVNDPTQDNAQISIPPSGAVQGIYANVAELRGVHKAPANERVRNAVGLLTDDLAIDFDVAQDLLNPIGVNVIRAFPGRGIRVFGARTLFSIKDGRHFVSGRRSLNFIKESIEEGTQFAVFEPLDENLTAQLDSTITSFLTEAWLAGILRPRSDRNQAFFVDCGPSVNPESQVLQGILNCRIGVSLTPPAEKIIFTITNFDSGRIVEEIS